MINVKERCKTRSMEFVIEIDTTGTTFHRYMNVVTLQVPVLALQPSTWRSYLKVGK